MVAMLVGESFQSPSGCVRNSVTAVRKAWPVGSWEDAVVLRSQRCMSSRKHEMPGSSPCASSRLPSPLLWQPGRWHSSVRTHRQKSSRPCCASAVLRSKLGSYITLPLLSSGLYTSKSAKSMSLMPNTKSTLANMLWPGVNELSRTNVLKSVHMCLLGNHCSGSVGGVSCRAKYPPWIPTPAITTTAASEKGLTVRPPTWTLWAMQGR
mmetsp:Transcript_60201/g.176679  ORF Transcript_60201/g.176679 Transcript_60201/m.176679 type:complete len:208 (-) Transcript_60201:2123-2746(-)